MSCDFYMSLALPHDDESWSAMWYFLILLTYFKKYVPGLTVCICFTLHFILSDVALHSQVYWHNGYIFVIFRHYASLK